MLHRFTGDDGKQLLREILSGTTLLREPSSIDSFLDASELIEIASGQAIIRQGESDNAIFLVVSGSFDIVINGRRVANRKVGSHFGEIASIDPTARRTATVLAIEHSLVLKCAESRFASIANDNPKIWQRIAIEMSRRLTERNQLIRQPRAEPVLFIGCSKEALELAREIQAAFTYDSIVVEIWTDGIFHPSKTAIEDLTQLLGRIDFGALLLTPDDKIESRAEESFGPRDNVIFELGLIIGAIGRDRTFMLLSRGQEVKLPTDLLGVKPIDYPVADSSVMKSKLAPACHELRKIINNLGPL
jgi:CRP/FNR family cyclic AMP-dependent transcriptional regulator